MSVPSTFAQLLPLFSIQGSLEDYLVRVTEFCRTTFKADGVSLFLRIDGTDTFVLAAQSGPRAQLPWTASVTVDKGIAGMSASDGAPIILNGTADWSSHPAKETIGSSMVVPLITLQAESVGILNISRSTGAQGYNESDLEGAEAIARHLALAVDNASLVARHKADADRYAALAEQNRRVLDSLPSGVVALDRARRVVQANASALRLLHQPLNHPATDWETLAKNLSPEGKAAIDRCLAAAASGNESRVSIEEPDSRHLQVRASQGAAFGITLIIDDITHDIEIERELQRTRTLAEIGQMTSAIAHEIRNPLTSISGAAQMVLDERTLDGAKGWAKVVQQEALQLNDLCDEFLDFAKGVVLNPGETSVDAVVTELLMQMDSQLIDSGTRVSFEPGDQVPVILADKAKLSQAIRNLILNGAEAMVGGGELRIRTEARKNCVLIRVEDHGIGIPEENMARLFTPFFTTKSRGTGLGLCNVRRVIEAHGGSVEVTSRVGVGTEFTLFLPMRSRP